MLRNGAGGKVWQYGVSATPFLLAVSHISSSKRVCLFAELACGNRAGSVIGDTAIQHRLRRTICKGWRNKAMAWSPHGLSRIVLGRRSMYFRAALRRVRHHA